MRRSNRDWRREAPEQLEEIRVGLSARGRWDHQWREEQGQLHADIDCLEEMYEDDYSWYDDMLLMDLERELEEIDRARELDDEQQDRDVEWEERIWVGPPGVDRPWEPDEIEVSFSRWVATEHPERLE